MVNSFSYFRILVILKSKNKKIAKNLNFRISGQRIKPSTQVKYLGLTLQDDLHWNKHLKNLEKKLSRSIGLLSKIRHYVPKYLLRTIYYSICNSHLIYACEIWRQSQNTLLFKKILKLQEKAIQIINLKHPNTPVGPLLKDNRILKISDFINYKNAMLVRSILGKENLAIFNEMFLTLNQNHNYNTRTAMNHLFDTPKILTVHYGENSVR